MIKAIPPGNVNLNCGSILGPTPKPLIVLCASKLVQAAGFWTPQTRTLQSPSNYRFEPGSLFKAEIQVRNLKIQVCHINGKTNKEANYGGGLTIMCKSKPSIDWSDVVLKVEPLYQETYHQNINYKNYTLCEDGTVAIGTELPPGLYRGVSLQLPSFPDLSQFEDQLNNENGWFKSTVTLFEEGTWSKDQLEF